MLICSHPECQTSAGCRCAERAWTRQIVETPTHPAHRTRYADGLLDAMIVVAEVSGPLKLGDFNEATWQMLCRIQERLAAKAADAFRAEAVPPETPAG